jgi:hypothetical protein
VAELNYEIRMTQMMASSTETSHIALKIQTLAWDRHKNVAELNYEIRMTQMMATSTECQI